MFWLAIPFAFALTIRDYQYAEPSDGGTVPRNVRFLEHRVWSGSYHVPGRPFACARVDEERGLLTLHHALFKADHDYSVVSPNHLAITVFHTNDVIDHTPPSGGELLGATLADMCCGNSRGLVLLFRPAADESPVWAEVEWRRTAGADSIGLVDLGDGISQPAPEKHDIRRAEPTWTPPPRDFDAMRALVPLNTDVLRALDASGASSPIAAVPLGNKRDGALRTRWLDAAGNTSPWGPWFSVPQPLRGIAWVKDAPSG